MSSSTCNKPEISSLWAEAYQDEQRFSRKERGGWKSKGGWEKDKAGQETEKSPSRGQRKGWSRERGTIEGTATYLECQVLLQHVQGSHRAAGGALHVHLSLQALHPVPQILQQSLELLDLEADS